MRIDGGGVCNGVGYHNEVLNIYDSNTTSSIWLEEPIKSYEDPRQGQCYNVIVDYNSVTELSRIGYETQCYITRPRHLDLYPVQQLGNAL